MDDNIIKEFLDLPTNIKRQYAYEATFKHDRTIKFMDVLEAYLEQSKELAQLRKFKAYVHARLDEAGIPTHPEGEHSKHGCRIGDRLDIALSNSNEFKQLRAEREGLIEMISNQIQAYNIAIEKQLEKKEVLRARQSVYRLIYNHIFQQIKSKLTDSAQPCGRFGHNPNPAIDFCVEVDEIEAIAFNIEKGISGENKSEFFNRLFKALQFRVGGDEGAIKAKERLRALQNKLTDAAQSGEGE